MSCKYLLILRQGLLQSLVSIVLDDQLELCHPVTRELRHHGPLILSKLRIETISLILIAAPSQGEGPSLFSAVAGRSAYLSVCCALSELLPWPSLPPSHVPVPRPPRLSHERVPRPSLVPQPPLHALSQPQPSSPPLLGSVPCSRGRVPVWEKSRIR